MTKRKQVGLTFKVIRNRVELPSYSTERAVQAQTTDTLPIIGEDGEGPEST